MVPHARGAFRCSASGSRGSTSCPVTFRTATAGRRRLPADTRTGQARIAGAPLRSKGGWRTTHRQIRVPVPRPPRLSEALRGAFSVRAPPHPAAAERPPPARCPGGWPPVFAGLPPCAEAPCGRPAGHTELWPLRRSGPAVFRSRKTLFRREIEKFREKLCAFEQSKKKRGAKISGRARLDFQPFFPPEPGWGRARAKHL